MTTAGKRVAKLSGFITLCLALALTGALPGFGAAPARPRIDGTWKLNPDLTARLAKDQQQDGPSSEDSGKGHRHGNGTASTGPMGNTSPGGSFGRVPEPEDGGLGAGGTSLPKRDPSRGELMTSLDRLVIAQEEGQVTIIDHGGHPRVVKTNGSKIRDEKAAGGPAWLRANWDRDDALVVEVRPASGSKRTESYVVSNDHKHLYVTVVVGQESPVLLAYDQVLDAAPTAPEAPTAPIAPSSPGAPPS